MTQKDIDAIIPSAAELAGIYANKLAADKLGGYAWIPAVSAVRAAIIDSLQTLKSND